MRFLVLACDYDGTLAEHGVVRPETIDALVAVRTSGRKVLLVTGRDLDDLARACPRLDLFDRIVAENGGVIYDPAARERRALAPAPPQRFVQELRQRGVTPLSVGRTIVATWEPNDVEVLAAIRDLGLELQVIFNKGAVMVLPSGINKATGLTAALAELGTSPHNVVAVGDAENDHAFLTACEFGVAVGNALPSVKERVDAVMTRDHGGGVEELVGHLLGDDLEALDARTTRHHLPIGERGDGGGTLTLAPHGTRLLVAGPSGAGKSTVALALLERLAESGYQFCVVDPEGDHADVPEAVVARGADAETLLDQIAGLLAEPSVNVVANLVDLAMEERPAFFRRLLSRLGDLRVASGRPHWTIVDEAHHLLPAGQAAPDDRLASAFDNVVFVTVEPTHLAAEAAAIASACIVVGSDPRDVLRGLAGFRIEPLPDIAAPDERPVWYLQRDAPPAPVVVSPPSRERLRHRRKYAEGRLGEDKSFYFRGADDRLRLRAHNLAVFLQMAEGVDAETWQFHLERGDYQRWLRDAIKDADLAALAETLEHADLPPDESRAQLLGAIRDRYTLPA